MGRYYIWFVVVVTGLAGLPRLLLARRFAELQLARLRQKSNTTQVRTMSMIFLFGALFFVALYFTAGGHQAWLIIGVIFSLLSAIEFLLESRVPTLDTLIFQKRLLGILYLGLSVGSFFMLPRE
ncbi:MAG TPA: hypothetical protein VN176_11410 [Verrucomicrobiae bacterium]|nr:hypothetical protein [Verrucomicrobiae bacterium]